MVLKLLHAPEHFPKSMKRYEHTTYKTATISYASPPPLDQPEMLAYGESSTGMFRTKFILKLVAINTVGCMYRVLPMSCARATALESDLY